MDPVAGAPGDASGDAREPDASGHTHESACLNCGAELGAVFCQYCGQKAHLHRTLGAFGHDLLHGVLHLEGKTWRTLPMLAWRPGELTRRYIHGERARFVSPLAMFLFSVFLMFAVFSAFSSALQINPNGITEGLGDNISQAEGEIARLEVQKTGQAERGQPTRQTEEQIRAAREQLSLLRTMAKEGLFRGAQLRLSDDLPEWMKKPLEKLAENPSLVFYKLQTNAYKFSWALIPISLPFLWLLFLNRRRYRHHGAYDHVVFITYSIAFATMVSIVLALLMVAGAPANWLLLSFVLVMSVHMFRQLKGAYPIGRFGALWRTGAMMLFGFSAFAIFLLGLLAMGLLG